MEARPKCTLCPRHKDCRSVGIPTRCFLSAGETSPALLVVGEAPGRREDRVGECFVGKSGQYLQTGYIRAFGFDKLATVYFANAVRCFSPNKPNKTAINKCRFWLQNDVIDILDHHKKLTILCCGSFAAQAVLGTEINKALRIQGCRLPDDLWDVDDRRETKVFSTYHPAFIMEGRSPASRRAVYDHLTLLKHYLKGEFQPNAALAMTEWTPSHKAPLIPDWKSDGKYLSLDIETYGIIEGQRQTQFHPRKSVKHDGIKRDDLVATCSYTFRSGARLRGSVRDFRDPEERRWLGWLIQTAAREGWSIVGQNLQFDIQYLRYCRVKIPAFKIPLIDTIVTNYLEYELRPEKSLKSLSKLFGISHYGDSLVQYKSVEDPGLQTYNQQDTASTILLQEYLERKIEERWGKDSIKLSDYSRRWFSNLLWMLIRMSENGVAFDETKLKDLHKNTVSVMDSLRSDYEHLYDEPLSGKGSGKALDKFFPSAVEELDLLDHPSLELTRETKKISTGKANLALLLDHAPLDTTMGARINSIAEYRKAEKMVSSYTRPLLEGNVRAGEKVLSSCLIQGVVYPSWFPVPSTIKDDPSSGGTAQGRLAAKQPAAQTFPQLVRDCIVSRWKGGRVLTFDLSQIELRVAALLSGDPIMMREYEEGIDRHANTIITVMGKDIVNAPDFRSVWRQGGKHANFCIIYGGSAPVLKATIKRLVGVDWPVSQCQEIIRANQQRYERYIEWQKEQLDEVLDRQALFLPFTGHSRTFVGRSMKELTDSYYTEIRNMMIQGTAALILQSAQVGTTKWLERRRSMMILNCHDDFSVDCYPGEEDDVREFVSSIMISPPYYQKLCKQLDRTVPLEYECK